MTGGVVARVNDRCIEALVGLDASVSRKVFVRCIKGLMGARTRILVSKDPSVIRAADRVVRAAN